MWINFRGDPANGVIYWSTSGAPVSGDDRVNIECPPVWENDVEKLLTLYGSGASTCYERDDCEYGIIASVHGTPDQAGRGHSPGCYLWMGRPDRLDVPFDPNVNAFRPEPE